MSLTVVEATRGQLSRQRGSLVVELRPWPLDKAVVVDDIEVDLDAEARSVTEMQPVVRNPRLALDDIEGELERVHTEIGLNVQRRVALEDGVLEQLDLRRRGDQMCVGDQAEPGPEVVWDKLDRRPATPLDSLAAPGVPLRVPPRSHHLRGARLRPEFHVAGVVCGLDRFLDPVGALRSRVVYEFFDRVSVVGFPEFPPCMSIEHNFRVLRRLFQHFDRPSVLGWPDAWAVLVSEEPASLKCRRLLNVSLWLHVHPRARIQRYLRRGSPLVLHCEDIEYRGSVFFREVPTVESPILWRSDE